MHDWIKQSRVFSYYGKQMLLVILLIFPVTAVASDPRGLFWPAVIALTLLGLCVFGVSAAFIIHWVDDKFKRNLLVGFFFGLFLGPIYTPGDVFIPNIANLFTSVGGNGLVYAVAYACVYSVVIAIIFFAFSKKK